MTNGGFAAIAVALRAIVEPGDEVVFLSPPWFFYELLILAAGGDAGAGHARAAGLRPGRRRDRGRDHAADAGGPPQLAAQPERPGLSARGPRSARRRAGRGVASGTAGRPSGRRDEPYNRIVFDGARVPQPGRGLPGHDRDLLVRQDPARARACASATSPCRRRCPTARRCARIMFIAQIAAGYAFPNALLQHALERPRAAVDRRRRRSSGGATGSSARCATMGYETTLPEGTFYVMATRARSPTTRRSRSTSSRNTACSSCPARSSSCRGGSASR